MENWVGFVRAKWRARDIPNVSGALMRLERLPLPNCIKHNRDDASKEYSVVFRETLAPY